MVPLIIAVFAASLILDFGIPYSYYLYVTRFKGKSFDPHRAINSYFSGMIGDAVCAPFINTMLFLTYFDLTVPLKTTIILYCLAIGLFIMSLLHLAQAKMEMTNWSMPKPWQWTFPGKYHMFSATIQFSFIGFSLFSIYQNLAIISQSPIRLTYILITLIFVLLFNVSFTRDTFFYKAAPAENFSQS